MLPDLSLHKSKADDVIMLIVLENGIYIDINMRRKTKVLEDATNFSFEIVFMVATDFPAQAKSLSLSILFSEATFLLRPF